MLIQLGLRLLLADVSNWKRKMDKNGTQTMWNQSLLCPRGPVSTTTSQIKLLHSTGGPCSEPTERSTTAGPGELDSVLDAHTQSKLMDICTLMTVYRFCNLCSMKEFMNFHFVMPSFVFLIPKTTWLGWQKHCNLGSNKCFTYVTELLSHKRRAQRLLLWFTLIQSRFFEFQIIFTPVYRPNCSRDLRRWPP